MNFFDHFNANRLLYSLQYMWQGMLSIFLVIGVIILSVVLMNQLTAPRKNKE